jgi:hypothetical protein
VAGWQQKARSRKKQQHNQQNTTPTSLAAEAAIVEVKIKHGQREE